MDIGTSHPVKIRRLMIHSENWKLWSEGLATCPGPRAQWWMFVGPFLSSKQVWRTDGCQLTLRGSLLPLSKLYCLKRALTRLETLHLHGYWNPKSIKYCFCQEFDFNKVFECKHCKTLSGWVYTYCTIYTVYVSKLGYNHIIKVRLFDQHSTPTQH